MRFVGSAGWTMRSIGFTTLLTSLILPTPLAATTRPADAIPKRACGTLPTGAVRPCVFPLQNQKAAVIAEAEPVRPPLPRTSRFFGVPFFPFLWLLGGTILAASQGDEGGPDGVSPE
jgi:hypothetical protein